MRPQRAAHSIEGEAGDVYCRQAEGAEVRRGSGWDQTSLRKHDWMDVRSPVGEALHTGKGGQSTKASPLTVFSHLRIMGGGDVSFGDDGDVGHVELAGLRVGDVGFEKRGGGSESRFM